MLPDFLHRVTFPHGYNILIPLSFTTLCYLHEVTKPRESSNFRWKRVKIMKSHFFVSVLTKSENICNLSEILAKLSFNGQNNINNVSNFVIILNILRPTVMMKLAT